MSRWLWVLPGARAGGLALLVSGGCGLQPYTQYGTTGETTGTTGEATGGSVTSSVEVTGATTGSTTTGPATTTSGTSGSGTSTGGGTPDLPADDCDGWIMPVQDCPEGQKCTFDGWADQSHCVGVVDDPKDMYEPCHVLMGDTMSGYDDCGPGLICWGVDPDTGIGECIGFCLGPPDSPSCADPLAACTICQDCALGWCVPPCDPLGQDCSDAEVCIPNPQNPDRFICVLDASGEEGQVFDACEFTNGCDPGLLCAGPGLGVECDALAIGCCLPFCDTTMPACPGVGQECLPWYEMGMAPPGFENLGVCGVPP